MKRSRIVTTAWLRLVEPEGQWLSPPVLRRAFPQGFAGLATDVRDELHERYPGHNAPDRRAWVAWEEWLLRDVLAWGLRYRTGDAAGQYCFDVPEHNVVLRADAVLDDPERGKPRVLMMRFAHGTPFDKRISADRWNASPVERVTQLCRANGVHIGLVSDGERIALVWVPASGAGGYATWDTSLFLESKERELLRAFVDLLGAARFFSVSEDQQLEALFEESERKQSELTDRLGYQVRQAVELLVAAISRANLERNGELLRGIPPREVYEAAVTILMRLVFLLYAEERDLLPLDEPLYVENYAVSTLRETLDGQATLEGDAPLERRNAAWYRLLAVFRAIYAGVAHDRLRLPPYGGRLFDPERYKFLERFPIDDLTVRAMLEAVQTIAEPGTPERRRLSYRTLDVEQIGHVYEGLLDHGAERVDDVYVRLVGRSGDEAEIPLRDLERAAGDGEQKLVSFLIEYTKKTEGAIRKLIERGQTLEWDVTKRRALNTACDNDTTLANRIAPFVYALDEDLHDLPTVFPPKSLVVKQTRLRRDTGTEYTPRELAEEMVQYALEPLVYSPGPKDGAEPKDWRLRPSAELLKLRICDPACGSGAFLVAACRYLADRVVEAWLGEQPDRTKVDADELTLDARRAVVDHCLYGVDKDAMAVEMAKLSLWLITLGRERPFTFLDHAIRHGDSLLGVTSLDQIRYVHINPEEGRTIYDGALFDATAVVTELVEEAVSLREELGAIPSLTVRDAELKRAKYEQAEEVLYRVKVVADAITAAALMTAGKSERQRKAHYIELSVRVRAALDATSTDLNRRGSIETLRSESERMLNEGNPISSSPHVTFHWPLAFAEVFARGGFDLVAGNPPFMGGKKITGALGTDYRDYLVFSVSNGKPGSADLVAYFFLRGAVISTNMALLAVNTVAQGDTREIGLDLLKSQGWSIVRAVRSRAWPGRASVHIVQAWLSLNPGGQQPVLDGKQADRITSFLTVSGRAVGAPFRLAENANIAFIGSIVLGMGFTMSPLDARALIRKDSRNREILFPFLNAEDLLTQPDADASRWIINFFDWPLEQCLEYSDCIRIVRDLVKPKRDLNKKANYRTLWWQYAERCPGLYRAISQLATTIVMPQVSKIILPLLHPTRAVFSHSLAVIASDSLATLGVLTSEVHRGWARRYGSTHLKLTNYSVTDCFETFAFPSNDLPVVRQATQTLTAYRYESMRLLGIGLTRLYNRVHRATDIDSSIERLRELHAALDRVVCDAYGWTDLDLAHDFHQTDEGVRWTVANEVRDEILDRLLELNHQRHAEEVSKGLVSADGKPRRRRAAEKSQIQLLARA